MIHLCNTLCHPKILSQSNKKVQKRGQTYSKCEINLNILATLCPCSYKLYNLKFDEEIFRNDNVLAEVFVSDGQTDRWIDKAITM